ncbi:MAG: zinc ABC transporter permease [Zetaproteobacteria bacterium CG2_30_46_52]|nr:MAG: zinc ABC transporter permease [Zetaproteobacteria bacterium CG2_30_46_52]
MFDFIHAFFSSTVMQEALFPALLIAVVTSSMSIMVLAHRLSFLTVGVSHASLAGLGLAVTLSLPLLPTATFTAIGIALLLALMPNRQGINEDAGTGMLFAGSMALGVILISSASRNEVDLFGLLFGNILTVSAEDTRWITYGSIIVMLSLITWSRSWWSMAFDMITATASGIATSRLRLVLYGIMGLTVVMCVKLAGIVLTTGLLVLPAACAWFWGRSMFSLWGLSLLFSLTGTLGGLMWSYHYDWPSGAAIILMLCLLFTLSWGASWLSNKSSH